MVAHNAKRYNSAKVTIARIVMLPARGSFTGSTVLYSAQAILLYRGIAFQEIRNDEYQR